MESGYIKKIGMIILLHKDLEAAVAFYQKLGLRLKFQLKDRWAEFEIDGVKIGLCPTSQELPPRRTGLVLEVGNVQQVFDELKDTVEFLEAPVEAVHGIMVSMKDPGGNIIDLYQPTPEKVRDLVKSVKENEPDSDGCCGAQEDEEGSCSEGESEKQDPKSGQKCCKDVHF
jgi:catechol 2,3-dioxygenase-like lactoylglutathione lyase family enzyme